MSDKLNNYDFLWNHWWTQIDVVGILRFHAFGERSNSLEKVTRKKALLKDVLVVEVLHDIFLVD
jgi:hypothetical protein